MFATATAPAARTRRLQWSDSGRNYVTPFVSHTWVNGTHVLTTPDGQRVAVPTGKVIAWRG